MPAPKVRHPHFDYSAIMADQSHHYFAGNSLATHLLNALHVVIPPGEDFMIRNVRPFIDRLSAPVKKNAKLFMGQEKIHAARHYDFWQVLEKQGLQPAVFYRFYYGTAYGVIEPALKKHFDPEMLLALTAGLEHSFNVLGTAALDPEQNLLAEASPGARDLFLWHAAEEIEHRSFAFDILSDIDDDYLLRMSGYLVSALVLGGYTAACMAWFLLHDRQVNLTRVLADLPGFFRLTRKLPGMIAQSFVDYFKPGYHPSETENDFLIKDINRWDMPYRSRDVKPGPA